jgi:hypothetical protein
MAETETSERHDLVMMRMQTLIEELDKSIARVRALLQLSLSRQDLLRSERDELRERCNRLMHKIQELEAREQ